MTIDGRWFTVGTTAVLVALVAVVLGAGLGEWHARREAAMERLWDGPTDHGIATLTRASSAAPDGYALVDVTNVGAQGLRLVGSSPDEYMEVAPGATMRQPVHNQLDLRVACDIVPSPIPTLSTLRHIIGTGDPENLHPVDGFDDDVDCDYLVPAGAGAWRCAP